MIYPRLGVIVSISVLIFVAVGGPIFVRGQDQHASVEGSAPSGIDSRTGQNSAEKAIQEALDVKASLELHAIPLTEAIEQIKQSHHLLIQLDLERLKSAGIDPATTLVDINVHEIPLCTALRLLLAQCKLSCLIRDEVLFVVPAEQAGAYLETVVYDVHDLLLTDSMGQLDSDALIKLLCDCVDPQSWGELGGVASCEPGPAGTLIIDQTQEAQKKIGNLFAALRQIKRGDKPRDSRQPIDFEAILQSRRIEKILSDKVDFDWQRKSLSEIFDFLRKLDGIDVVIDRATLKDANIDLEGAEVTFGGSKVSLRSALKVALAQLNVVAMVDHGVLLITTKGKANEAQTISLYSIDDFLPKSDRSIATADSINVAKQIASDIEKTIGLTSWDNQGANGSLNIWGQDHPVLVVLQTEENHQQIASLLNKLRKVRQQQESEAASTPEKQPEPESIVLRVYDLRVSGPSGPAMTPQEAADLVKALVEPKSWTQGDVFIRGVTGKLVVRQVPSIHRQIEKLLDQLGASVPTTGSKPQSAASGGGF